MKMRLKIITEPDWKKWFVKYLVFHMDSKNCPFILRRLIRKSVFKGISVGELYVLDRLMIKQWSKLTELEQRLFLYIVSLCGATRKGATNWDTRLRPVLKRLKTSVWSSGLYYNIPLVETLDLLDLPVSDVGIELTIYPIWIPRDESPAFSGWIRSNSAAGHGGMTPPHIVKDPLGFESDVLDFETFALQILSTQHLYIETENHLTA